MRRYTLGTAPRGEQLRILGQPWLQDRVEQPNCFPAALELVLHGRRRRDLATSTFSPGVASFLDRLRTCLQLIDKVLRQAVLDEYVFLFFRHFRHRPRGREEHLRHLGGLRHPERLVHSRRAKDFACDARDWKHVLRVQRTTQLAL